MISEEKIRPFLKGEMGKELVVYDVIDSTNNAAKLLAKNGAPHGSAVVARGQTAGKGRMGRSFYSPADAGVYLTVILRPEFSVDRTVLLTSAAAVAVSRAIEAVSGVRVRIKWVNDLYYAGKKLCGILAESAFAPGGELAYMVLGIGVNLTAGSFPPELSGIVTALSDAGPRVDGNRLIAEILNELDVVYRDLERRDFLEEYRSRSCVLGKRVRMVRGEEVREGLALEIDRDAHLLVRGDDGKMIIISSGEVSLKGNWL